MEKQWFVFKNDHHEGPYSEEYILREYRQGRLKDTSLVWEERLENWSPLRDQPFFQKLFYKSENIQKSEDKKSKILPPIPSLEAVSLPVEDDVADFVSDSVVVEKKSASYFRLSTSLIIVVVLSLLGGGAYMAFSLLKRVVPPAVVLLNVSQEQRDRIESTLRSNTAAQHGLGLTEDKNGLWFAYGLPLTGSVSLYLKSRKNQILSKEAVEVFASQKMVAGLAVFNKFETLRGTALVFGEYDYKIHLRPEGFSESLGRFLRSMKFFRNEKWMDIFGDIIKFEGTFHYYGNDDDDFKEQLKAFNEKKQFRQQNLPLIDQLEKLRVFYAMMEKIKVFFDKTLKQAKVGEDFTSLENHYVQNISPLLQKITFDSHEKSVNLMDSKALAAAEHREIFESGKRVMGFVADVIEKTTSIKRYTGPVREKIMKEFERDYTDVLIQLNTALEKRKKKSKMFLKE